MDFVFHEQNSQKSSLSTTWDYTESFCHYGKECQGINPSYATFTWSQSCADMLMLIKGFHTLNVIMETVCKWSKFKAALRIIFYYSEYCDQLITSLSHHLVFTNSWCFWRNNKNKQIKRKNPQTTKWATSSWTFRSFIINWAKIHSPLCLSLTAHNLPSSLVTVTFYWHFVDINFINRWLTSQNVKVHTTWCQCYKARKALVQLTLHI